MAYKKIIILISIFFLAKSSYSNILYDKKDLIITSIDLETYIELYESNYGTQINKNNALKDLVLINNLIRNLEKNNKEFLNQIDEAIIKQYKDISYTDLNVRNFYRFTKIRSEFIVEYFNNKLSLQEIEYIFSEFENLNLPISKNNCLIIEKVIDLKSNKDFILNFFNNLKKNSSEFEIIINDEKYRVCIDEKRFRSIEKIIVDYLYSKTKDDFEYFVYGKTNN
tara:strand:+ start:246 stop:917 length:672 start_codon:yes stop_codon:yes gene_type:complete